MHHISPTPIYFLWLITSFQIMESFFFWGDPKEIVVFNIFFSHDPIPNAISIRKDSPP